MPTFLNRPEFLMDTPCAVIPFERDHSLSHRFYPAGENYSLNHPEMDLFDVENVVFFIGFACSKAATVTYDTWFFDKL